MASEIEQLEEYIKFNYKSKSLFSKELGMTPQNLNHHIRFAKKNENIFSDDFKMKLIYSGISIFPRPGKPTLDFANGTNEALINENLSLKREIDKLNQYVDNLNKVVERQEKTLLYYENQIKGKVISSKTKTGG